MEYVFLQSMSFGGAIIFASVEDGISDNWEQQKSIDIINPLILSRQLNPKHEVVNSVSPFPTIDLPVVERNKLKILVDQIVWLKKLSTINASNKEIKLIDELKSMQSQAYSNLIIK